MALPFKVESDLTPDDLRSLQAFVREKNGTRTTDECWEWTQAHGYTISRSAVGGWLAKFRAELAAERTSRNVELATAIRGAMAGGSFDDVTAAANQQLVQVVFEQVSRLQTEGDVDTEAVESMTRSLKNLVGTKAQHTKMLAEKFDQEATKLAGKLEGKQQITAADIDEVRKAVFG